MKSRNYAFLSYHERDLEFVLWLTTDLKNKNVPVWAACLELTNETEEDQRKRIKNASVVIALISIDYLYSEYCHSDIRTALESHIPIIYVSFLVPNSQIEPAPPSLLYLQDVTYSVKLLPQTNWGYSQQLDELLLLLGKFLHLSNISPTPKHRQYINSLIEKTLCDFLNDPLNKVHQRDTCLYHADLAGIKLLGTNDWLNEAFFAVSDSHVFGGELKREIFSNFRRTKVADLAKQFTGLVIAGKRGSGKTSILQQLLLDAIYRYRAVSDGEPFPIYLDLMDWDEVTSLHDFVYMNWPFTDDPFLAFAQGIAVVFLDNIEAIVDNNDLRKSALIDWLGGNIAPARIVLTYSTESYDLPDFILQCNLPIVFRIDKCIDTIEGSAEASLSTGNATGELLDKLWLSCSPAISKEARQECEKGLLLLAANMTDAGRTFISKNAALELVPKRILQIANSIRVLEIHKTQIKFSRIQFQDYFAAMSLDPLRLLDKVKSPVSSSETKRIPQSWDNPIKYLVNFNQDSDSLIKDLAARDPFLALDCVVNRSNQSTKTYDLIVNLAVEFMRVGGDFRLTLAQLLTRQNPISAKKILIELLYDSDVDDRRYLALDTFRNIDLSDFRSSLDSIVDLANERTIEQFVTMPQKVFQGMTPFIVDLLKASDNNTRCAVTNLAGRSRQRFMISLLLNSFADIDDKVVVAAISAAQFIRSSVFVKHFVQFAHTPPPRSRKFTQRRSIEVLNQFGKVGTEGLMALLDRSISPEVRLNAAKSLQDAKVPLIESVLSQLTRDEDPTIRMFVIESLTPHDTQSTGRLIQALKDTCRRLYDQVRICDRAAQILENSNNATVISKLKRWQKKNHQSGIPLKKPHADDGQSVPHTSSKLVKTRLLASKAYSKAPEHRVQQTVNLVSDDGHTDIAKSNLIQILAEGSSDHKVCASSRMADYKGDAEIIAALLRSLRDWDQKVVIASLDALKHVLPGLIGEVLELMNDPEVNLKGAAIDIAGYFSDAGAISALKMCLDDTRSSWIFDKRICDAAAEVLEKIATPQAMAILSEWRDSRNKRGLPEQAFGVDPSSVAIFQDLHSDMWDARQHALKELQRTARNSRGTSNAPLLARQLLPLLNDTDWVIRWASTEALGWIGDQSVIPLLSRLVTDPNWKVRISTIRAMAEIGDRQSILPIASALIDPNPNVREAAAESLGVFKTVDTIQLLAEVSIDTEPFVRLAAVESLSKIKDEAVVQLLIKALDDEHSDVRWAAAQGLEKIRGNTSSITPTEKPEDASGPYWEHRRITDLVSGSRKNVDSSIVIKK